MQFSRYTEGDSDDGDKSEDYSYKSGKKKGSKREETYVSIGTPLPEIEDFDAAAKKQSRPVIQARVHGPKLQPGSDMPRLHGAFTGGFSAGYFNTVGSKEGFVPSTFVSSRQQRAQLSDQKPSDYMDEEDVSEHGIAPREIRTSDAFTSMAKIEDNVAQSMKRLPSTVIPEFATSLASIVSPTDSNIGISLLISMGWRHGQGTGPRKVEDRQTQKSELSQAGSKTGKIYGCSLPPDFQLPASDEESVGEDVQNIPPIDLTPLKYVPKSDVHGLGYSGMSTDESTLETSALFAAVGKRGIRGHAFGVGFEGEEHEDADIYGVDSLKNYDLSLDEKGEKDEGSNIFSGWTAPALTAPPGKAKPLAPRVVAGFLISSHPLFRRQASNLPELPGNYRPVKGFRSAPPETIPLSRFDQKEAMTARTRAAILDSPGDVTSGKKASVFDYIRPEDKVKLDAAVSSTKPKLQEEYEATETPSLPKKPQRPFDPRKPFASEPEKQSRYEAFLQFRQINKDYSDLDLPSGMTEWEQQQEHEQFERTARLFQPLSWSISQRFTRESSTAADDDTSTEVVRDDVSDNLAQKKQAVSMKMFGNLTRSVVEWHPAPLLCKRFNVRNPYPDSQIVGLPKVRRSKFSIFNFLNVSEMSGPSPGAAQADTVKESETVQEEEKMESDKPVLDTSVLSEENVDDEEVRPSMDIFAAIFGEESEHEEDAEEAKGDNEPLPSSPVQAIVTPGGEPSAQHSVPVPSDPERARREEGISAFLAGIFGENAFRSAPKSGVPSTTQSRPYDATEKQSPKASEATFGPKLPLNLVVGVPTIHDAVDISSSSPSFSDDVQVISSDSTDGEKGNAGVDTRKKKPKRDKKKNKKRHKRNKHSKKHSKKHKRK